MQIHDPALSDRIYQCRLCARFIDDWLVLNNALVAHLRYNNQLHGGIKGIFPPYLDVQQQAALPGGTPFLDILLILDVSGQTARFSTNLYDKRYQPAFARLPISRFVHRSSNVNEASKFAILAGCFHRLRVVITDVKNFIKEIGFIISVLVSRDYPKRRLLSRLKMLLIRSPDAYGVDRRDLTVDIYAGVARFLSDRRI